MADNVGLFNTALFKKDKTMVKFLLTLLIIHASLYTIENTSTFTLNFQTQVKKIRLNNIEKLLYLVVAIVVFVVGANLGFKGAGFAESYKELAIFFEIYIASLLVAFICNSLCAMTEPLIAPLNENGNVPTFPFPNGTPYLSPTRNKFFFTVAQYLLTITFQMQTILLSYFSFGLVASYTASYSLGLLSRSLGGKTSFQSLTSL
jgi:hypothetical protein